MGGRSGPHRSFCGTYTGPFSEIEGPFTVLICSPCVEVRLAQPDSLLGLDDPGQPEAHGPAWTLVPAGVPLRAGSARPAIA
jgi:hypothetical protein